MLAVPGIVAPSSVSANAVLAYPVPTTVTVVPTDADAGLMTVTDVESIVNATELKVAPVNASVCTPAVLETIVNSPVAGVGHAEAAGRLVAVTVDPLRLTPVGVVPK